MDLDPATPAPAFLFETFRFDRHGGLSRRREDGSWAQMAVGSRALDVLRTLVEQRGELVTKQALMDAAWGGVTVEDANLTVQMSALRRILDEGRSGASCIQTVIGRGYRFLPAVTREIAPAHPRSASAPPGITQPPIGNSEPPRDMPVTKLPVATPAPRGFPLWLTVAVALIMGALGFGARQGDRGWQPEL